MNSQTKSGGTSGGPARVGGVVKAALRGIFRRAGTRPVDEAREAPRIAASAEHAEPGTAKRLPQAVVQLRDELGALLQAQPGDGRDLHLLGLFVAEFGRSGPAALDTLALPVLKAARWQLQRVAGSGASIQLVMLGLQMEDALARREGEATWQASRDNRPSDIMVLDRLEVSEGRMTDFMNLTAEINKPDGSGAR